MRVFSVFSLSVLTVFAALPGAPANAQSADSAKRFVHLLYTHYANHGPGLDFAGQKTTDFFDASFVALVRADEKALGPDSVTVFDDADPFCGCQEWDGIWDLTISIQMLGQDRAKAAISFALFAPKAGANPDLRSLEMSLVTQGRQWRIDNILDRSDPKAPFDLRAEMEKEVRTSKQAASTHDSKAKSNVRGPAR